MTKRYRPLTLLRWLTTCVLIVAPVWAQGSDRQSTQSDLRNVALTVYNNDLGLVREVRRVELPKGTFRLRYMDVPARIDPTTVHVRGLGAGDLLTVLEQNYEYDLLNPQKLLDRYVGREVTLVVRQLENNTERFVERKATLLSHNEGGTVWRIDNQIVINPSITGEIRFPEIPENLIARPTLVWLLDSASAGAQDVESAYLTNGISWRADYVLAVNAQDNGGDLNGWVTINNQSGAGYRDAEINLIAGDVHRAPQTIRSEEAFRTMEMAAKAPQQFEERAFFEYHLYRLQRRATVKDRETKQIGFLTASDLKLQKEYRLNGQAYYYRQQLAPGEPLRDRVEVALTFKNETANHLGMPLPAGIVRVYKSDSQAGQQFIGEDRLEHTPKDESVRVRVGDAFDIVAERKQIDYRVLGPRLYEMEYEVVVRNHKKEPASITVNEPIGGDWQIIRYSYPAQKTAAFADRL